MDKFLIKKPRNPATRTEQKAKPKQLIQSTIESLRGVVVVEDIERLRTILRVKDQTPNNLLSAIEQLNDKIPSRSVLKSTKIGHIVNRLTKHTDVHVAKQATLLVKKWKQHFEEKLDKPLLEVKCDRKTEELRTAAKKHLGAALQISSSNTMSKLIEQEVFHQHNRLVSAPYRRTMRKLVFTLKHHSDIRDQVLNKTLDVPDLVTQYKQQAKVS